jgi:DNA polymerase III epsilon subunit family exonuclease
VLCESCEGKYNLEAVLDQLLLYKNCTTENKTLGEYVLSFNSWSEIADEVLRLCSKYPGRNLDYNYYIASAYKNKGKNYRTEFIKYALNYMDSPTKDKVKTTELVRDLAKTYSAEYEFYKAIGVCDLLLSPEYEFINANLLKAENLLKIRKIREAIELLEDAHSDLVKLRDIGKFYCEEEKLNNEKLIGIFKATISDYKEKQDRGYIYIPNTEVGKQKLQELLDKEGRHPENTTIKHQTEAKFNSFVAFDFETTGFGNYDKITEIGAVKVVNGKITEYFSELVNPKRRIPEKVTEVTGITNDMVRDKETINKILPKFLDFAADSILVAHNAKFDCRFLLKEAQQLGCEINNPVMDTMELAKRKLPGRTSYKLTALTEHFGIEQQEAHRAYCDAEATAKLYMKLKRL